jgi:hypothetical protein
MENRSAAVTMRTAALLLFALGLFPLANVLTNSAALPWYRHALLVWILIGGTLLLLLTLMAKLFGPAMESAWSRVTASTMHVPWPIFVGACAVAAFALSALLAVFCFGRQPHNADEVAQLFHAKILLTGHLTLPLDPNPEFFEMDQMIDRGRWYSQFPIGGPAFLAVGMLLRAAWLLNPALIALSLVSTAAFARRTYGEPTARAVSLLFALCPFALFMGASFMNHVPTMWLVSVAMWQLARWYDAPTQRDALVSATLIGLTLGVAFAVRPLDAIAAAIVIGALQLAALARTPKRLATLVAQVAAGIVPATIVLVVNAHTNGSPFTLGYEILYGTAHQLGFHVDPYGTMHTPLRALTFASKYLLQLNVLLFEWPLPAVGIIIAGLLATRSPRRWDLFLVGMLAAQVVAYAFYWHDGSFRGPRFLFTALPAIIVLVARAPLAISERVRGSARIVAVYALPACVLFAWLAYGTGDSIPGRIRQYRSASIVTRVDPDSVARSAGLHHALVFINEGREARALHYLWSLGMSRGDAFRLVVSAPSCAVHLSIEAEESIKPPHMSGRRDRLIRGALAVGVRTPEPETCVQDSRLDSEGTASYVPFFAANNIDDQGHVSGDVIYALDLGARNETLRARFGDRRWYRFGAQQAGDTLPRIRPY